MCKRNSTDLTEKERGEKEKKKRKKKESMGCVRETSHRKIKQPWDV